MIILIQCKDKVGLVAVIAQVMAGNGINILSMREHVDTIEGQFFLRLATDSHSDAGKLYDELKAVLPADAAITVNPQPEKKIVVMVTKEYHCLGDILMRNHFKTLGATVQAVIGNHAVLQDICERFAVPFIHVSHELKSKEQFEAELESHLQQYEYDYLVLAKFMRILSPAFIAKHPPSIINIHHSFLPAFVGASPYKQAFVRGVKLIGATAHFVTNNLDEGPIIEQQIIPVNHTFTPAAMVTAGKEIEKAVLAKALKMLFEDRVFVYNNKTVVFE
ncbi:formyltetrahydrofolate deformylase [Terrimonas pollutisoli]|uniref:formyltetrahydrofolate deformylase n=1 Tax=Terrimonas pollutisoli TaxID=3034147 RepID=UPI0023EBA040|nr:formyltetrahydrofolate deformylase [Terrimonas sp. H1YJ31]